MTTITAQSLKVALPFKAGALPSIDPADPRLEILLGPARIGGRVNPKAARKLASHQGGAVLQGRLVVENGRLAIADAGFQWIEPTEPAATA